MKTLYTLLALIVTTVMFAQNPIVKDMGDFNTVKVYDRIVVNLVKSDENKVIISNTNKDDQKSIFVD